MGATVPSVGSAPHEGGPETATLVSWVDANGRKVPVRNIRVLAADLLEHPQQVLQSLSGDVSCWRLMAKE